MRRLTRRLASSRLGDCVMVVLQPVLVAHDLAVELVHQLVDRGIEVLVRLFDEDVPALDVQRHLGLLPSFLLLQLLDRQQHVDVDDLVEVARHAIQLCEHVLTQSGRHFEVMSADRQVHQNLHGEGGQPARNGAAGRGRLWGETGQEAVGRAAGTSVVTP